MISSTPNTPFIHFENLFNLIYMGIEKSKQFKGKVDIFKAFHDTIKDVQRVFIPSNGAMSCLRFDIESPMLMFPFQELKTQQYLADNNWQKLFIENSLTKLPHDYMFLQMEFSKKGFMLQDEKGNLVNTIFAAGLFLRNVVIDKQNKIAIGYGLLHNNGNPNGKPAYDIMSSIHLLSVTDKKVKVTRTDFNFNPLESVSNTALPDFERYILSRIAMTMLLKKKNMNGVFVEGVFEVQKIKRNNN